MLKRLLALFLCVFICPALVSAVPRRLSHTNAAPSLSAESAVLIEANGGNILCEKNAHSRMAMASTTKIMTALVAAEKGDLDRVVSVSAEAVGVEGSSIYLYAGERITLGDLLSAMLLESANDAAAAIAIEIGGSIEGFCEMMNDKAAELGLTDTHFTNPHGLFDENHYTTAYELAIIAREAMKNETIRDTVATRKLIIEPVVGNVRTLYNHNKMLAMYEGANGIKTGFTKKSGRCLIGSAERDGLLLISVTLNAPDDWSDHRSLFNFGFENFSSINLASRKTTCYMQDIMGGNEQKLPLLYEDDVFVTLEKSSGQQVKMIVETFNRYEVAPIYEGKTFGRAVWLLDGEEIAEVALISALSVEREKTNGSLFSKIINLFK